jgi:elongation factor Ts
VARNEQFQHFVTTLLTCIKDKKVSDVDSLMAVSLPEGRTVAEDLSLQVATIGESLSVRRLQTLEVSQGIVASYVHGAIVPGMGKIGVLVALESAAPAAALGEMGRQVAMHVAAAKPLFLSIADVDSEALARERAIFLEQAKASGRPDAVIEKMVDGRLRKYFEESVLEEQVFVVDGKTKISDVLNEKAKELGHPVHLKGFVRMALGEGIEKVQTDFAAEVQAQIK